MTNLIVKPDPEPISFMPVTYPSGVRQNIKVTWPILVTLSCKAFIQQISLNEVMLNEMRSYLKA